MTRKSARSSRRRQRPSPKRGYLFYRRGFNKVAKLARLINVEYKHNIIVSSATFSSAPSVITLIAVDQGDTSVTRDGDSIKVTYLSLRGSIFLDSSATATVCRLLVVMKKAGGATTVANVMANNVLGERNDLYLDNYHVFADHTLSVHTYKPMLTFHWTFPLNHHLKWNNATGTAVNQTLNTIQLILIASEATNVPLCNLNSYCQFVDN